MKFKSTYIWAALTVSSSIAAALVSDLTTLHNLTYTLGTLSVGLAVATLISAGHIDSNY